MAITRTLLFVAVAVAAVASTVGTDIDNEEVLDARKHGYGYNAGNVDMRASNTDNDTAKDSDDVTVTENEHAEIDDDDTEDDETVNPTEQTPDNETKSVLANKDGVETRSDFQFGLDGIKNPIKAIGDFFKALPKLPKLSWSGKVGDDEDGKTPGEKVDEEHDSNKYETKKVDETEEESYQTTFPTDSWQDRESKDYYKYWYNTD